MNQKTIINYSGNFKEKFTDRSLVDKAYVDNRIAEATEKDPIYQQEKEQVVKVVTAEW